MSKKFWAVFAVFALLAAVYTAPSRAADEDTKPKYSTKDIMKNAFKGPLLKKVAGGQASEEEKKTLHEMLVALNKNVPQKGEPESWTQLTAVLVKASQGVLDG